jgi:hypothetical protein
MRGCVPEKVITQHNNAQPWFDAVALWIHSRGQSLEIIAVRDCNNAAPTVLLATALHA